MASAVSTGQVRRNRQRFPPDFMFWLTQEEYVTLRLQIATSSSRAHGGRRVFAAGVHRAWRNYGRQRREESERGSNEHRRRPGLCQASSDAPDQCRFREKARRRPRRSTTNSSPWCLRRSANSLPPPPPLRKRIGFRSSAAATSNCALARRTSRCPNDSLAWDSRRPRPPGVARDGGYFGAGRRGRSRRDRRCPARRLGWSSVAAPVQRGWARRTSRAAIFSTASRSGPLQLSVRADLTPPVDDGKSPSRLPASSAWTSSCTCP